MMKHATPDSMKFKQLQRRLGESRRGTAGLLELLWIATQKNARRGDIGRFTNEEIAAECDWDGDADELINALVDCKWLDRCYEHRLVVHGWSEHCPVYLKKAIADAGGFAVAKQALTHIDPDLGTTISRPGSIDPAYRPLSLDQGLNNQTRPDQTRPNEISLCQDSDNDTTLVLSSVALFPEAIQKQNAIDDLVEEFVSLWKSRPRIPKFRVLTPDRRKKLVTRLKNPDWPWREALSQLPVPGGDGSWQPTIDWAIENDRNMLRIVEGDFKWRESRNQHVAQPPKRQIITTIER